jgi:hypothetical protein
VIAVFALGLFPDEPMRKTDNWRREHYQLLVAGERTGSRTAADEIGAAARPNRTQVPRCNQYRKHAMNWQTISSPCSRASAACGDRHMLGLRDPRRAARAVHSAASLISVGSRRHRRTLAIVHRLQRRAVCRANSRTDATAALGKAIVLALAPSCC